MKPGSRGLANLVFWLSFWRGVHQQADFFAEAIMLAAAFGSYFTTRQSVHEVNRFHFHPIQEVAILFIGIFATMMPALDWLGANAHELLGQIPRRNFYGARHTFQHARQRADLSRLFERAFRDERANDIENCWPALLGSDCHQCRRGVFRRGDLHRKRAEFHDKSHADHEKFTCRRFPDLF